MQERWHTPCPRCSLEMRRRLIIAALIMALFPIGGFGRIDASVRRPTLRWKFATDDWVLALAVGRDGIVYAGTWTGNSVYAIHPDGTLKQKLSVGNYGVGDLGVGKDGTIYAFSGSTLYALNQDGKLRWHAGVTGPVGDQYPTLYREYVASGSDRMLTVGEHGTIYVRPDEGYVFALPPKLPATLPSGILAVAFGHGGIIYVGTHVVHTFTDPTTGALRYRVGRSEPVIYAIDSKSGSTIWSSTVSRGKIFALKLARDGTVYVGSYDGNIYALDPRDGKLEWRFSTGGPGWGESPVHALAVSEDGTIYAGAGRFVEAIRPP